MTIFIESIISGIGLTLGMILVLGVFGAFRSVKKDKGDIE
jgi:hypothetical protein